MVSKTKHQCNKEGILEKWIILSWDVHPRTPNNSQQSMTNQHHCCNERDFGRNRKHSKYCDETKGAGTLITGFQ
jgi:hypothetical protein